MRTCLHLDTTIEQNVMMPQETENFRQIQLRRCALGKGREGLVSQDDCRRCADFVAGPALPGPLRCPFLRRRVRDEAGKIKTRWCTTGG